MPHHSVHNGVRFQTHKAFKELDGHYAKAHDGRDHAPAMPHEADQAHDHLMGAPKNPQVLSTKIAMGNDAHPYPSDMQPMPPGEPE